MPYCRNCGVQLTENVRYCYKCGTQVNPQNYTNPQTQIPPQQTTSLATTITNNSGPAIKDSLIIYGLVMLIILIITIIIVITFLTPFNIDIFNRQNPFLEPPGINKVNLNFAFFRRYIPIFF